MKLIKSNVSTNMLFGFNKLKLFELFKKMKREWQSKIVKEKREV
jgi:hypothetical protein